MRHAGLRELLLEDEAFRRLMEGQGTAGDETLWGLSEPARALVTAALVCDRQAGNVLFITPDSVSAHRAHLALTTWLGEERVSLLPVLEVLPYEVVAQISAAGPDRVRALYSLNKPGQVLVIPATALPRRLVPSAIFREHCFGLREQDRVDLQELSRDLVQSGYRRVDLVQLSGEFSIRGGIVDIFSPAHSHPVRLELFGDEIDQLRFFSPEDQRSIDDVAEATIIPAREFIVTSEARRRGREALAGAYQRAVPRVCTEEQERLARSIDEVLERLDQGIWWDGLVAYAPFFYPSLALVFDYALADSLLIFNEPQRIGQVLSQWEEELAGIYASRLDKGMLLTEQLHVYASVGDIMEEATNVSQLHMSLLAPPEQADDGRRIATRDSVSFGGNWTGLVQEIKRHQSEGRRIVLAVGDTDKANRLTEQLREEAITPVLASTLEKPPARGTVTVLHLRLPAGFELPSVGLVLLSEVEIYGRRPKRSRLLSRRKRAGAADWLEFRAGDYVVHEVHGIGKYLGVRSLEIEGNKRDYLFIQYAGSDALYVPTDQVRLIEKYVGREGHQPRLSRLGGTDWSKVKNRVKKSVQAMAEELLRLYAAREKIEGHAFSTDTVWQQEFEADFTYEDTPDQIKATQEIKEDMQRQRPMDRLLCGDVGYGKTEVAMRAAFKAVMDGKQVGILVPTTILAQQHWHTFRERFDGYPVRIEMLSRFRSAKEQQHVLDLVFQGKVDIVIGTHRLLSKDVKFSDLGLLVVDEEQRFGVAHKERLKQLRQSVDVLTLTATPIPRTLHMAMTGLRDISMIDTPPENRYPVQTYVLPHDDDLVRDAIARELSRQGQVFYVHNRVRSMESVARRLSELLPEAEIASAHGQMQEEHLEQLMLEFLDGEYDVLACTTIIESGLDMPNVNTLVVENADKMGLAQLYQLRGRVGRSERLAYAYFMYRRDKLLSEVAGKRLHAISEFTELGSGFKLAMRDLEIRGAGNILGPEQHGFIVAVGFDLYCQLLEEALRDLQGLPSPEVKPGVSVELGINAFLPDYYVPDGRQKLDLYKRLAACDCLEAVHEITEELIDRFGDMVPAAKNLVAVARIRAYALSLGLVSISQAHGRVWFKPRAGQTLPVTALKDTYPQYRLRVTGGSVRSPALAMRTQEGSQETLLSDIETFLRLLVGLQTKKGETT